MGFFGDARSLASILPLSRPRKFITLMKIGYHVFRSDSFFSDAAPRNAEQALEALGLPADWTYDRQQLDRVSHERAAAAWARGGFSRSVCAVIASKVMLISRAEDGMPNDTYLDMIEPD